MSHTDPNGQTTHYSGYDSQRRPQSVTYADGTSVTYTYDSGFKGKLSKLQVSGTDPQSITFQYDPRGNIIAETRSWGGETVSLESVIDDSGLILKSKAPLTGKWLDYRYDGLGRVTQISFPLNGASTPIISDIQYSANNLLLGYSLPPSNISATRKYSPQNDRLLAITYTGPTYVTYKDWESAERANALNRLDLPQYRQDPVVTGNALLYFSQSYQYDPAGNRVQMTHKEHKDTFNFTYEYDKLNALIAYSAAINGSDPITQRYTYDPQGNRTSLSQPDIKMSIAYHAQNNTPESLWFGLSKTDGNFAEFTHDKNGNRLSKSLKSNANATLSQSTYTWDARNRMIQYQLDDLANTTSRYQFNGPRYEKKDTISGKTTTTRYVVDANHRLLSETIEDNTSQKAYAYIYLGNQKLARISQNDVSKKDEVTYFLTDSIGSAVFTTYHHTASPNAPILISQSLLDPWGNSVRNGMFYHTAQQDFTGKVQDPTSGLYDFGFRYYDPLVAAWIGKDLVPADHNAPLSLNEYLYCLVNPLMFVDPDGRLPYNQLVENQQIVWNNFGPRWIDPKTNNYSKTYQEGFKKRAKDHMGTDIAARKGSSIVAAAAGEVVFSGPISGYGNTVVLKHKTNTGIMYSLYAHMTDINKNARMGETILEGDQVGTIGGTNGTKKEFAPHLHFEIRKDNGSVFNFTQPQINPETLNLGKYDFLQEKK